ncbi:hypothetical protein BU23DRAFT_538598 [Bimuria novae-zelandiae CBS 107.79]|uniref:Sacsin/Nov domain-containing protein n=1 Tax=Bimuria novae-zelandiae CBS 107.79 TaxID=1447943 RepID=A0A6A5VA95_9PLEO|nr:hypothetical protein BU23DRAFT_538598 [Bimuria novae-zelandiae CBS 107.79]
MASVDFARLRNQTMADGQDSEVTVNTRALIDKVLARYSSEHTTLRELIQNASDAGASKVVIKFETDPSLETPTPQGSEKSVLLKHIIQHHTLKRLIVSNNGQPFTSADWSRLKSIADGNPDETKIGAFGVGFYSVFADCDEPFVVSGDKTMAFYWKGNTLSTKVATVPQEHRTSDTTFSLDYRQADLSSPSYNPAKVPNLPTLCQFLATSLTFVGLQSLELHIDNHKVASFTKKTSPAAPLQVPKGLKTDTEGGFMRVAQVTQQHSQIDAEWSNVIASAQNPPKRAAELVQTEVRNAGTALKSFFSKFSAPTPKASKPQITPKISDKLTTDTDDITGESTGVIFLQVSTVEVDVSVLRSFAAEIERATKKPPPRKTKIALLTSPYQDPTVPFSTGTGNTADLASRIFSEVLPTKVGRIFIGFPTAQTTGVLAHVSAPSLIPTVERENVDLNARYISQWNIELLRVAGLACRILYTSDMADIQRRYGKEPMDLLIQRAIYVFQQFTSNASHPSTLLGEKIEEAFWSCSKERSIEMLSTKGVMPSKQVRMPAETLSFLGEVPMVPQDLATRAYTFMLSLHRRGFISELTMADIREGLESRALTEDELVEFLKWAGAKLEGGEIDASGMRSLFDITLANIEVYSEEKTGRLLSLGEVSTYINTARITPTLPVPPDTIPFAFSKLIPVKQLQMFGWIELSMVRWLRHMTAIPQLQEFQSSEKLALQVLSLVAKCWDQLDGASKEAVVNLLTPHAVMPTKTGIHKPEQSYFPSVKLFNDLPTVKAFPGSKERFLAALGVRKTVELSVVFDRMRSQDSGSNSEKPSWNHIDLIRYFASVMDEMPKKDLDRLKDTPFLPGEGSPVQSGQVFKASQLYAPDQAVLSLGLVQIKLPFEFKPNVRENTLLLRLGLKQWPDSIVLANIMHKAGQANNAPLYSMALNYFIQNHFKHGYASEANKLAALSLPILPTEQAPWPTLVGPFQCYTNERASCLGYAILRADLRPHAEKFGVQHNPDIQDAVQRLIKTPPKNKLDAEMQFAYFASRLTELDQRKSLLSSISTAHIVPVFRRYYHDAHSIGFEDRTRAQSGKSEMRLHHHDPPETVFVGQDQEYKGILDYVQYAAEATNFLLKVGAKHEPSSHDLAYLLCRNPIRFLNTIGQERYLDLLRKLAVKADDLWKDKELAKTLAASRILLGYRDIKDEKKSLAAAQEDALDDLDEPGVHREWSLNSANEVVIIDDVVFYSRFRDFIIAAPQEEGLEDFYARFGVKKISEQVKEEQRIGNLTRDQSAAHRLRHDILERSRLFLHEYERDASSKSIRHDTKWLSSNVKVECVSDISIRYSLSDRAATSHRRSAIINRKRGTGTILYITPTYDVYEVSSQLVRLLIKKPKQNDAIALERILTEPLRRLQEKGINVERILRKKEHEARVARQQELERELEEQQRATEQAKQGAARIENAAPPATNALPAMPGTPDKAKEKGMPGAFGSPENDEVGGGDHGHDSTLRPPEKSVFNQWAKKLGFKNTPTAPTDIGQITRENNTVTKNNIQNAIKDCRPINQQNINSRHHQDPPTELDKGGYCNDEQWENLHKAFSIPYSGRHVDIFYGKDHSEALADIQVELNLFLPIVFNLASLFGVNPAAVNVFLDKQSRTVAFNQNRALFFNLGWFMQMHATEYATRQGRARALDSWFLTFCHELAHNLVSDHNARFIWYQSQIAIEYSQGFRGLLERFLMDVKGE